MHRSARLRTGVRARARDEKRRPFLAGWSVGRKVLVTGPVARRGPQTRVTVGRPWRRVRLWAVDVREREDRLAGRTGGRILKISFGTATEGLGLCGAERGELRASQLLDQLRGRLGIQLQGAQRTHPQTARTWSRPYSSCIAAMPRNSAKRRGGRRGKVENDPAPGSSVRCRLQRHRARVTAPTGWQDFRPALLRAPSRAALLGGGTRWYHSTTLYRRATSARRSRPGRRNRVVEKRGCR